MIRKFLTFVFVLSSCTAYARKAHEINDKTSIQPPTSKVVVITGASQGIGLATATYLAQHGHIVCAGVRTIPASPQLEVLTQKFPNRVMIVHQDVTNQTTINASCTAILKRFGRKALYNFMHKQLDLAPNTPGIIEPHEVAECIEQIINTEKPHLHYQLETFAQEIAQERFKDPTGNSYVQAKKEQFAQLEFVIGDDQS